MKRVGQMGARAEWDVVTWNDLTPRQQSIMHALARGLSNQEIADELGVSLPTVRNNIAEVYDMLGISNRVQALLWVLSHEDIAAEVMASV